jgi:ethanolamine kinase
MLLETPVSYEFDIPKLSYEVNLEQANEDTAILLKQLFDASSARFEIFEGGLTNKLMRASFCYEGANMEVLIRIFGSNTNLIIDRETEKENMIMLSSYGFGPQLYAYFDNGMVYGFVKGIQFQVADLRDDHKSGLVAKHMAAWHQLPTRHQEPQLFIVLEKWLNMIPNRYRKSNVQSRMARFRYSKETLRQEYHELKRKINALNSPVVFCHNDIQIGNIIYNDEQDSVMFIDYEYGGVSYRGFDIGNHFCEFAGFDLDYSLYPDKEFRRTWLIKYLSLYQDGNVSDDYIETMDREILAFSLCSHFFWSVWALVNNSSNVDSGRTQRY